MTSATVEDQSVCIHVTAQRKADEIETVLVRNGLDVRHCPTITTTPVLEDQDLLEVTRDIIRANPDLVVVTTGIGFRGWMAAAESAGLKEELTKSLGGAMILARGAKARGAVVGEGLEAAWVSSEETAADVADHLRGLDVAGRSVVVQHHGMGADGLDDVARSLGASVTPVVTYRYAPATNTTDIDRSISESVTGRPVGVLFTSAGGAEAWLDRVSTTEIDALARLSAAGTTGLFAVGSVTAQPLVDAGLTPIIPHRFRLGTLLKKVIEWSERIQEEHVQGEEP
ncbi:uroporphyrinogen-III synthase [Rothia sp. HC945]|uniref:uroporphyrinogen-III synthase n=1 Tax=Rothia sp. HC945 TaxID=3171170 RepID=UPI003F22F116